jgi:thioesterase domain-containing protein
LFYDLTLLFRDGPQGLECVFLYPEGWYESARLQEFAAALPKILATAISAPLLPLPRLRQSQRVAPPELATPLNPNGKLDRAALPPPDKTGTAGPAYEAPRTEIERELAAIWADVLHRSNIGIHDNFFHLGGHSLIAVRLVNRINQMLKTHLSIPSFFLNPTIAHLGKILQLEVQYEPRIIQLESGRVPSTWCFLDSSIGLCRLAESLTPRPRCLATVVPLSPTVQRAAQLRQTEALPTVETLAAAHAQLILSQAPLEPYCLVGHSFGGLLAFEVAHQLQRCGKQVDLVVLIDSWAQMPPWWRKLKILTPQRFWKSISFRAAHWWHSRQRTYPAPFSEKMVASPPIKNGDLANPAPPQLQGHPTWEVTEQVYRNAWKQYRIRPVNCRAILFRASQSTEIHLHSIDKFMGWRNVFVKGLQIEDIPGDHPSILAGSNLTVLARKLQDFL